VTRDSWSSKGLLDELCSEVRSKTIAGYPEPGILCICGRVKAFPAVLATPKDSPSVDHMVQETSMLPISFCLIQQTLMYVSRKTFVTNSFIGYTIGTVPIHAELWGLPLEVRTALRQLRL
jgi:hypothetical protein